MVVWGALCWVLRDIIRMSGQGGTVIPPGAGSFFPSLGLTGPRGASTIAAMKEWDLINWITAQGLDGEAILVGPGDDCAVLAIDGRQVLVTVDQVIDGVHVDVARCGPAAAGRKALARNLSDIAAMAGEPTAAVASVILPKGADDSVGQEVYRGLRMLADEFGCPIVGGDVAMANQPLSISVTVLGQMPMGRAPILRSGASAGEVLCVTGQLGRAWQNGRDLVFAPRLAAATELASTCMPSAMIDLSDGLASDLRHLCCASGCGAIIDTAVVPLAPGATVEQALGDGEDYELLFAVPAEQAHALCQVGLAGVSVTRIGELTDGNDIMLRDIRGEQIPMPPLGWEHRG
jgi:thiamine-monophosphate kinase